MKNPKTRLKSKRNTNPKKMKTRKPQGSVDPRLQILMLATALAAALAANKPELLAAILELLKALV